MTSARDEDGSQEERPRIATSQRRVSDPGEGDGICYEITDHHLIHAETKYGGKTPTVWPVVPVGTSDQRGCIVWSMTVYFDQHEKGPRRGRPGGPAFVAAAREQEKVADARSWLAPMPLEMGP